MEKIYIDEYKSQSAVNCQSSNLTKQYKFKLIACKPLKHQCPIKTS